MSKETITFDNIEIEKGKFHQCKNLFLLEDVEFDNILISRMLSSGENDYIIFYWLQR